MTFVASSANVVSSSKMSEVQLPVDCREFGVGFLESLLFENELEFFKGGNILGYFLVALSCLRICFETVAMIDCTFIDWEVMLKMYVLDRFSKYFEVFSSIAGNSLEM